jgi:hypothetical protein
MTRPLYRLEAEHFRTPSHLARILAPRWVRNLRIAEVGS